MKPISPAYVAMIAIALLLAFASAVWLLRGDPEVLLQQDEPELLPDFGALEPLAKKQLFFSYLQPKIDAANASIATDRKHLSNIARALTTRDLSSRELRFIDRLARDYAVNAEDPPDYKAITARLLKRVDSVPASLVLIQAAKESGWGTSQFAVQGYSLFGQHCFDAGCGFVPAARAAGRHHEVERFVSVDAAVEAYLHNLNTHPRYQELRDIRARQRADNNELKGSTLADGLLAYSERGAEYVIEVKAMIQHNRLE